MPTIRRLRVHCSSLLCLLYGDYRHRNAPNHADPGKYIDEKAGYGYITMYSATTAQQNGADFTKVILKLLTPACVFEKQHWLAKCSVQIIIQ
jgi:hypothetical protein